MESQQFDGFHCCTDVARFTTTSYSKSSSIEGKYDRAIR